MSALLALSAVSSRANPTGGQVASGTATITTVPGVVSVNQLTNKAVIDWQSFSIGAGELTKFVQPSSASATLNRVLGGQMSLIDGTLSSNGQIYLINGNGILVSATGAVSTAGFTASTRDIADADFLSGNLHFTGSGDAGVSNFGRISALGGDVILIGKTADNEGSIDASGHVGMAAADDVMISLSGLEHVFVRATSTATSAAGKTGVNNSGTIQAAAAELRAANGNIYALATNNSGIIRATGAANENGHIWLVAEGNQGVTQNTGTLVAGGQGEIETSGGSVVALGTVDAGKGGTWLIDPSDIAINAAAASTIDTTLNAGTNVTEDTSTGTGGSGNITVTSPLSWSTTATLNLYATLNLTISSAITASTGTLNVKSGNTGAVTDSAAVSVGTLNVQGGLWVQNATSLPGNVLPALTATNFSVTGGSSFLRVSGGDGSTASPFQIVDAFGLQGIGSSAAYLTDSWLVANAIDASHTSTWNSGAGFVPIGSTATPFTGTFNGGGDAISGLTINLPAATDTVGLFSKIGSTGTVLDVILTGASVTGLNGVGSIAGANAGMIETSNASGTVTGTNSASSINIGGLAGTSSGTIDSSFSTASVTGYGDTGGVVGQNTGTVSADHATGAVSSFLNAAASGSNIGGLVGLNNNGTVVLSFNGGGNVTATDTSHVGGLVGETTGSSAIVQQSYTTNSTINGFAQVGGLVGFNDAGSTVTTGKVNDSVGTVTVEGTTDVGGFVGNNAGTVSNSSVNTAGSVVAEDGIAATAASGIGGFVGNNNVAGGGLGTLSDDFSIISITEAAGTTDASKVGGFVGFNAASAVLSGVSSTGNVTGATSVGGLVGENDGSLGVQSNTTAPTTVTGTTNVGGLVGYNNGGTIGSQSFSTAIVSGTTNVGGLIGRNSTGSAMSGVYATGTVSGFSDVGGLIGLNDLLGAISSSYASGNITGTGGSNIGGLIGYSATTITLSYASGSVSAATSSRVGGLVGDNAGSIVSGSAGSQSYASGNVTGLTAVGGLVGLNESAGTVGDALSYVAALADYTHASGTVSGTTYVGGLVGDNAGHILQGSASGNVNGAASALGVGGLVGFSETTGTITTSFSSSTVHGNGSGSTNIGDTDSAVGGLVGQNFGTIFASYSTGVTVGDSATGGLIGLQDGAGAWVHQSYSTGNVTGLINTGGLVGYNLLGSVLQNYSISTVAGSVSVGGLVGLDTGSISQNYSTGSVSGTTDVGGLVGQVTAGGTLDQSYATGATSGSAATGGLAGLSAGSITNSYWDGTTTGQGAAGVGSGSAGTASEVSGAGAFDPTSYASFGTEAAPSGNNTAYTYSVSGTAVWYMFGTASRPFLAWEAPINNPTVGGAHVIYTAHELQLAGVDVSGSYVLGKSIDLSETQSASGLWDTTTGFYPIGNNSTVFSGSFSGATFGISNLYINRPTQSYQGLFGASTGSISGVSLSGNVTGQDFTGLLDGYLEGGSVTGARLSGSVSATSTVGGLTGENDGTVQSSAVNVAVSGNLSVGGISGSNMGTIEDTYSLGNIVATGSNPEYIGGIAGESSGTITISYETGSVTGGSASLGVGGAVGNQASGTITQTYATGAVSGFNEVGGLVGLLQDSLTQSYATGTVTASGSGGGLVGELGALGSVTRSYASGAVGGGGTEGGLIGFANNGGTYSNLLWDTTKATAAIGSDNTVGQGPITGITSASSVGGNAANYTGLDSTGTGFTEPAGSSALVFGSADGIWRALSGAEFPLLTNLSTQVSGTAYTDEGHTTPAAGATVTFNSGSNQLASTTTNGSGNYAFLFSADYGLLNYLPQANQTLRISDGAANADSVAAKLFNGNGVPDLLKDLETADTWGSTVRVVSTGLDNILLDTAGSSFVSNPGGNVYGGTNVLVSENFEIAAQAGSFAVDGDIKADGDFMVDAAAAVPASFDHPVTLDAVTSGLHAHPTFTQNAVISSNAFDRAVIVESDGTYVNNVGAGAFATPNGKWIVYSQNPPGSGAGFTDDTGGLNELHLYGTNPTQTPAYLLSPGLDYQIYSFTPELDIYASAATGASSTGVSNIQYGVAQPALGYSYDPTQLLSGDTLGSSGINQVMSNQPGEHTTYVQFSPQGTYPVSFISSTIPTSLIGYNLVFRSGSLIVGQNTSAAIISFDVAGSQHFGYIGGGPTFEVSNITGIVPGDPNFNPTFTTTLGQFANVYSGGVQVTYNGKISLVSASVANYNATFNVTDLGSIVIPAALTVTGTGTSIYGDSIVTPTLTSNSTAGSGLIYDSSGTGSTEALSGLGYTLGSTSVTSASHVGNTSFTVSGPSGTTTTGDLSNYNVTVNPGTYTITKRPVVITGDANETDIYDGTPDRISFGSTDYSVGATAAGTGLINGDVLTGTMGRASPTNGNVGTYLYTVGSLAATSDYTVSFANGGFGYSITARPITIGTLQDATKQYGSADPSFNFASGDFGITSGSLGTGDSFSSTGVLSRTAGETVNGGATYLFTGVGTVAVKNGSATNTGDYTITFDNTGNHGLTITPAPLTVTATDDTRTYDATAFSGGNGVTYMGFKFSDNAASLGAGLTYGGTSQGAVNAGSYTIIPSGYATGGNYTFTYVNGTLLVNKAPLTVTADAQGKTYGGTDPTLTYTASGTLYGASDIASGYAGLISGVAMTTATGSSATAGTHPITFTSGGTASNYSITDVNGTLTVSKAPLTVTADDTSVQYGLSPTLSDTVSGTLYYGDTASVVSGVTNTTTTGSAAVVGSYSITPSAGTAANYSLTYAPGTLTVTKAPLTVTADDKSKTYGGADPALTDTVSGTLYYSDTSSVVTGVTMTTSTGSSATAGTHAITFGSGGTASNYSITDVPGTLTVAQASLTETADPQSKTYGGADPALTTTASGTLFYGDTYSVVTPGTLSTTTGAAATAGTHPITFTTPSTAANYAVTDVGNTLTVAQAPLTVTPTNSSTTYGTAPVVNYVVGGTLYYGDTASVVSGVTLTTTFGTNPAVGTYSATAVGGTAANYSITDLGITTLTVSKANLYVTADDQSKVYGGADPTLTFTPSGTLFYGDSYSVISGVTVTTATGANATAGTHPITPVGGVASNYNIIDVAGTLTVSKANLVVTADPASKVYGAAEPTLTYTPSGTLYYGDTYGVISGVALSTVTGANATAGTHPITASGGVSANYNITDFGNTLTVSKADLTVTADNKNMAYGGTDPALTYTVSGLVYGDSPSVVSGVNLSTVTGSAATSGTHPITAAGGTSSNYNVTDLPGTLTVGQGALVITADPQTKIAGVTFVFNGTDYTVTGLLGSDVVTTVDLTSPATFSSAAPGTYAIDLAPNGVSGTGISNYTITFIGAPFKVLPGSLSGLPISWLERSEVGSLIGTMFDSSYGEKQFYELEVPGTLHRVTPPAFDGIGTGSSLVDVKIGLENIYSLDRFQSFRH